MNQRNLKRKAGSLLLAVAMIITSLPVFSTKVQASETSELSLFAFATKEQLMTAFSPNENGTSDTDTYGKLTFGKNSKNAVQNWYILGQDNGVAGENTVLFAADSIASGEFAGDSSYTAGANTGYGAEEKIINVYDNHYGASQLYKQLNEMAGSTNYFSAAEQKLMNETTVTTHDSKNDVDYTTTAKLYALASLEAALDNFDVKTIKAGSSNQIEISRVPYWTVLRDMDFWLRTPYSALSNYVMEAGRGAYVSGHSVRRDYESGVSPAFSLNLSSVLFSSAAKTSSSREAVSGKIYDGTSGGITTPHDMAAMTLRLNGNNQKIGTVIYDTTSGGIEARKDANAMGTVSLVVQGNDGTGNWYYSVPVGKTTVITKSQIQTACGIAGEINLADCKIWLETTEDNLSYATMAEAGEVNSTILESGRIGVFADATINNGSDGTVTIDKGSDGTVDITVRLPQAQSIEVFSDGKITVPAGGKVQTKGGKEITLSNGGMVDTDGNITVPAGGKVQIGTGEVVTLPAGGTVDKNENAEGGTIIVGDITVTAPAGKKAIADKDGNITVPVGGKVQIGTREEQTFLKGGTIDLAGNITEVSFEGIGTEEKPYVIKTEEDLKKLAELVNSGKDPKEAYYKIETEEGITLTEESSPWTPIGTVEHPFTGTFDGDGKTVKGLKISGGEPKDNQGFFGVNAGTIENLIIEGSVTGKDNVGGIAGKNTDTGMIKNCTLDVTVTGRNDVGGIAGKNDGIITGCTNKGSVTGSGSSGSGGSTTPGGNKPGTTPGGSKPGTTPGGSKPGTTPGNSLSGLTPEQKEKVNRLAKELNVPVETAKKLQEMAQELGIETDTLLLKDQDILNQKSEGDVKGSYFAKIQAKAIKVKKNRITVKWSKVRGADGYQIYAGKCGKNNKYKLLKTIKKAKTTSFTYKKLKKGTGYKFIVRAYKNVDGKKYTVAASKNVHVVTVGGKRTNPKSIKVNKKTVRIKKGKKFTIKSKIVKASSRKKLLNHRKLSYESANKKIATTSKKGVLRGKKKGKCYVYIYAENGVFKKIKVTVK